MLIAKTLEEDLASIGYSIQRDAGQVYFLDTLTGTRVKGEEITTHDLPQAPQLREAIERTEQEHRQRLAEDAEALYTTIQAKHVQLADSLAKDLEQAGANVWGRHSLSNTLVLLRMSYVPDRQNIESISALLEKAKGLPEGALEESTAHQAKRMRAVQMVLREREPQRDRSKGLSR